MTLILGTRGSRLALVQSRWVASQLIALGAEVELKVVQTKGDQLRDVGLQDQLEKGFFTSALEERLMDGRVDLVVHSLKDLPTVAAQGTQVITPIREASGDVLLFKPSFADPSRPLGLAAGTRVGTGAARRIALLTAADPELVNVPIRGNVPTRVAKVGNDVDAVVLARAGLARLGLSLNGLHGLDLVPASWIPAPGQGALGIQVPVEGRAAAMVARLTHARATRDVAMERGVLGAFEGGCHAAVGASVDTQAGVLFAGADTGTGWRCVTISLDQTDPHLLAVQALRAGGAVQEGPWIRPLTLWETQ
ncbi:MAG: hydroxymethylbilane synthase [Myxococcota bacterium]|jgi:hydroxymethylbilane synthase